MEAKPANNARLGTFTGVFVPTLLTILGAIMYLREGWVVGNAGLGGALLIILLANLITFTTALSISAVVTNIRVRGGGAFPMISQSLGMEVGGSVSVPLYLAQAIAVAFYLFAFSEGWQRIFPAHPTWAIVLVGFFVVSIVSVVGVNFAKNIQLLILVIVAVSLVSIYLGGVEALGGVGFQYAPAFWGSFSSGSFWEIFAVFFPAVTGILSGVSLSGALKDPRRSIPRGTLAGIGVSLLIYVTLAVWLARIASPAELINNLTIMVDRALFGPAVLVGILGATFSSALTSLVGAPRILRSMAEHGVIPKGETFARVTEQGDPRNAIYLTAGIALAALLFGLLTGGLNAIAPLVTLFFLIMYATLNGVVVLEQRLGLVSFRPLLNVPKIVPLIGLAGCITAMFLIAPVFSMLALITTLALYIYLSRRQLVTPWSDVRSGLFVSLAEWAAKRVAGMPTFQERAWKPSLLVPVQNTDILLGSYRFIEALTIPRGSVRVVGMYRPGNQEAVAGLKSLVDAFSRDGIFASITLLESEDYREGLQASLGVLRSVFFRPNAVFIPVEAGLDTAWLQTLVDKARANEMGTILYARHPVVSLGREQQVNVWIRDQSPQWEVGLRLSNLDLALLLAYQVTRNWHGQINLITVVAEEAERDPGQEFLDRLADLGRMPKGTRRIVHVGGFNEYLPQAPHADLNIFGLPPQFTEEFLEQMLRETNASCIFVRDSGYESALA
jgi:amino acid transporter